MIGISVVVCLYFLIITVAAFFLGWKKDSSVAFFGNNLSLAMCVALGAGEWMGGTSTTGVSEYGYKYGISGAWYTIANGIGILVLAIFFAGMFRRTGITTVSGIIGKYIGQKAGTVSGILILITLFAVGTSQMIALGTLGETLFHTSTALSILVGGSFVVLYTGIGGNNVIAKTNLVHIVVLMIGMIIALLLNIRQLGWNRIAIELPDTYFSMGSIGLPKVISWIIASVLGACTAQAGLQPILCAKDEKVAVKASMIIAFIVAPLGIVTALLGMIGRLYYPNLENPKLVLPILLTSLNPVMSTIMMIALFSAVVSTASPIILSCGTIIIKDMLAKSIIYDKCDEHRKILLSRGVTAFSGLICILLAINLASGNTILDIVYFAYSIRGSLFIILLMGMINRKYKERDAIVAMVLTAVVSIFWIFYKTAAGHYPIHPFFSETYIAVLVALLSSIVLGFVRSRDGEHSRVRSKMGDRKA